MSKNDVLSDIRGKIERERKLIVGFQALKKNTANVDVIQRCNTQIRETQSNIDYLEETLAKLLTSTGNGGSSGMTLSNHLPVADRPIYSRFDLIKYDCPSLGHKIQHMLQQLQFKLQVENQYREANQKISHLYLMDGDKSSSIAAEGGRVESDQRIQLLNKALRKYQNMHIDVEDVTRDFEIMSSPKHARKPLTGKLTIAITCIRDVDHVASPMFSKKSESIVIIKVDDVEKARTKGSRTDKWNEEFTIDVDKGNEIELSVFDKSNNLVPVAVNWALLSDITEEIRKKKVANEMGSSGWLSASNLSQTNTNVTSSANSSKAGFNNNLGASFNSTAPVSGTANDLASASSTLVSEQSAEQKVLINTWLSLEPVGQMLVTVGFEKTNSQGKQFMGGLGRHGAIRQKKEEVFEQHGHQFVQKQFYNIMCCALCGEFLRYTGYQCQDCKFLCHKKCYQKVVTKCISKSSTDVDDETKLNHRIPHRFEPIANRGTKWCCHCGYILPWGRKNVRKCSECGVMCHAHCTHLVPDFCGMSMEMANKILMTIKSTKTQPKPIGNVRNRQHNTTSSFQQPISQLQSTPKSSSVESRSDDMSDEEMDKDFEGKLPTETTNRFQAPADGPYGGKGRRPPPPPPESLKNHQRKPSREQNHQLDHVQYTTQQQYAQEPQQNGPIDYQIPDTYGRTTSHGAINEEPSRNPFDNNSGPIDEFSNFDYNNKHTQQYIVPDDPYIANNNAQQDNYQIEQPVPKPESKSPHKSKRRRRKVGLDDFQFLAVLGKGNFGKVMLAESRHTSNLCAIKVLKKDFIVENDEADSVKSEKRVFLTANKEKHPFLLNLHCCFQTENRIYFVMEYISGGDLMWHIQKSRFSAKRAKFYACEVLLGLKYFHDNGIVYRDLKLDNILLTTKGHIKIGDYGLCKENMFYKSTTGTFCGTPEFMAPEIIAGKPYDRSVDWWAFGVLLFQMLLCQSPFKGDDEDEIFNAIEHDDVKYPISMPRQTVLVLQALLTKDPSTRLGSTERDAEEIMEHPYFQDVNFDDVMNCRIPAPYLPEINSEHDYSNFDQEFTSETPRLTPVETVLTSEMQEQFRGFSHVSDNAAV
ncbi:uncharacterized protein RJT20DRAFT_90801 [Scheffersomyces xylosifermentans]|uniref:uncharacterized protein n=1 Tax=Scheffersomyces xylosifermentans TaxID=1304137 RepID=UPI00315D34DA